MSQDRMKVMKRRKTLNKYATNTSDPQKMIDELHQKRKDFKHLRDATAFGTMLNVFGPNYNDYRMDPSSVSQKHEEKKEEE